MDALRDKVEARKHELLMKLRDLKAEHDPKVDEARSKVKHQLDELEAHLKGGWDKVSEATRAKLHHWLDH